MGKTVLRDEILACCKFSGQTLESLAREIGLSREAFSRKINRNFLTLSEATIIVKTLVEWECFNTLPQLIEVMKLVGLKFDDNLLMELPPIKHLSDEKILLYLKNSLDSIGILNLLFTNPSITLTYVKHHSGYQVFLISAKPFKTFLP